MFLPVWLHSAEKRSDQMHVEDPVHKKTAAPNRLQNQTADSAASNSDFLIESAAALYANHTD